MTGFVMGVAILIMVGKFDDIFGYDPTDVHQQGRQGDRHPAPPGRLGHPHDRRRHRHDRAAFALKAIPKLERYALVLVVFLGTAIVSVLAIDDAAHLR